MGYTFQTGDTSLPEAQGPPPCPGQLLDSQLGLPLPCSSKWVKTEEEPATQTSMLGSSQKALRCYHDHASLPILDPADP